MHKWCIFSQFVAPTCFGRAFPTRLPHSAHASTRDILNIYTQLFNFNFNYQYTTRCFDCGEYIYKQLHLVRMHISFYYVLCNSAPWWWSSTTETCRCYKLREKNIYIHHLYILLVFISNYTTMHGVENIKLTSRSLSNARYVHNECVYWVR